MKRKIIAIDEERCNGCGACAAACHEGAIGMENGRAKLLRDDYCDGLGDCLPVCPTGAIRIEEREAAAYDERAVKRATTAGGCLGAAVRPLALGCASEVSGLANWPVQLRLAPVRAAYFDGAELLIAADCAAFARADFHAAFMRGRVTLIGCPKLDAADYRAKLTAIFRENAIRGVTVARLEVPCCGGLAAAAREALAASGKAVPLRIAILTIDGKDAAATEQ